MKKGFTLIELLAVVVILAVIALIAIPIILDMIEDSRKGAAIASGNGYVRAVNYKIAQEALNDRVVDESEEYIIGENSLILEGNNIDDITGSYVLSEGSVLWAGLCINGYSVEFNSITGHTVISSNNYCNGNTFSFVEPDVELMSSACKNENLYTDRSEFKIKTVEDLVCLSNLVSNSKDFTDKTIYLVNDIDINSDSSYKSKSTTDYGNINGNNSVEELKTELTTGAGFKPIGSDSKQFKGTFIGNAFTISNLMINRNSNYIGLFGYNAGTIKGVTLKGANITGNQNVGALVGYNAKTVNSVYVEGTVNGSENVGGVIGQSPNNTVATDIVSNSTVKGSNCVGGAYGRLNLATASAAVIGGKITGGALVAGYNYSSTITGGALSSIERTGSGSYDGEKYEKNSIFVLDNYIDTIVGGDNNSDGYYFDYDSNGKLNLLLSGYIKTPKGTGTSENPYIIKDYNDWKKVASTNLNNKYISLAENIDFDGKEFYPLGTKINKFKGNFDGNMKTISNIEVSGFNTVGLFGYNEGTIEGLNINTLTVKGMGQYIGGLTGYNTGTIKGINILNVNIPLQANNSTFSTIGGAIGYNGSIVSSIYVEGSVTGNSDTGGAVGESPNNTTASDIVAKVNVTGSNCIGGVFGRINVTTGSATTIGGSVTAGTNNAAGVVAGVYNRYSGQVVGGSLSTVPKVGATSYDSLEGEKFSILGITALDNYIDTIIGGDNNNDGYYLDYENGNYRFYSTKINPIPTVNGSGTQDNPYIIDSAEAWKKVVARNLDGKYIKVTSDIDFTNKMFYGLGSKNNSFKGYLNGGMHTISNVSVSGYSNVGLIGNNEGVIEGFNFNNITVAGTSNNIGIVGNNTGTIKGINATNVVVSASPTIGRNVGGLVGNTSGTVKEITMQATVSGYNDIGGVIGYGVQGKHILSNTVVSGNDEIGGIAGRIYGSNCHLTHVVQTGGSITASSRSGRVAFYADDKTKHYSLSTIARGTNDNYTSQGTDIDASSINNLEAISGYINIDTQATGDTDNSGYIFGYSNSKIVVLKAN